MVARDGVLIRPMRAADADQVLAVYQAGLDTGQASFETAAPAWEAFDAAKLPGHPLALIDSTEAAGIWTIQSSLFAENAGSLRSARGSRGRPRRAASCGRTRSAGTGRPGR